MLLHFNTSAASELGKEAFSPPSVKIHLKEMKMFTKLGKTSNREK